MQLPPSTPKNRRRRCWFSARPTPTSPKAHLRRSLPSSVSTAAASPPRSKLPYDPAWSPGRIGSSEGRGRSDMKRAAVCAAIAAILLAACGGGGSKKTAAKGSTTSVEETSTTVAGTTTTAAAGGATATTKASTKAGTSGGQVNGQPANNYTPPAGATPAKPATPGTYTEDNSGTSSFGPPPPKSPLVIDAPAGTRQHSTNDMRSGGKGSVSETTLDYQADGVHLVEVKVTTYTGPG